MAFKRAKKGGALIVLALLALLVVATRFNDGPDREQGPYSEKARIGITACTDKATGNYIPCPPNLRLREGR